MPPHLDIVCTGRAALDIFGVDGHGAVTETLRAHVGGCPLNVAVGLQRLGHASGLISKVGDDPSGVRVREFLNEEGVYADVETTRERATPLVFLQELPRGEIRAFPHNAHTAEQTLELTSVHRALIDSAQLMYLAGSSLLTPKGRTYANEVARHAHRSDTKVIFDLDIRPALWNLEYPNQEGNASALACNAITDFIRDTTITTVFGSLSECDKLGGVEAVLKLGAENVVSHDQHGAEERSHTGQRYTVKAFSVETLNVLGAGDAFCAAYLSALLQDKSITERLRYAHGAGAWTTQTRGCAETYPTHQELTAFLREQDTIA